LLGVLCARAALAHSASADVTVGKGYFGLNAFGELELVADQTFLTLGYSGARPSPYSAFAHLVNAGVEHSAGDHLLLSATLSGGPPAATPVELSPELTYRSITSSLGAMAGAAYGSGGFDFFEYSIDATAGVTAHWLARELDGRFGKVRRRTEVTVFKPSVGVTAILDMDTELTLRGSYWLYSEDPVQPGSHTDVVLDRLIAPAPARAERLRFTEEQVQAALSLFSDRLGQASAVSGLPAAPLWFELKLSAAHRFGRSLRGQLGYAFDRYVPGQGSAHLLSTRWTVRVGERLKLSAALALQLDLLPPDAEGQPRPPAPSGLFTVGAEYTF
jgi:hypothetical protein